ncbi:MAG: Delta-aminolevulinic acid dehydratase [Phycisphaerae bacterium]|nr:Delta-aminolevulinic acid dehydratase [Phycisphaerae bacterium]
MSFPIERPRRVRSNPILRNMVRETRLSKECLIYPLFACPGKGVKKEISSMPGQYQMSIDQIVEESCRVQDLGLPAVLLFGLPEHKDAKGSEGFAADGIVPRAIAAIKEKCSGLAVMADACLCEYTDHGHCGIITRTPGKGVVDNDPSLELLAAEAVAYAQAGVDLVAPSAMMDGQVQAIRSALDSQGFEHLPIMAYAAKYASCFYGPFREAAESAPQFGDRRGYQMDPANSDEALRETALDIEEGADIVMVKPAIHFLDIIYRVKHEFGMPTAAYFVSGEFAQIKAAVQRGWLDEPRTAIESHLAIRRAGADMIITYYAKELLQWL